MVVKLKPRFTYLITIWIYWWTRLRNLDELPIFLDEAAHIWWARLVWEWQPFHAASDGRLFNVIWACMFWPFNGSVWIARTATVFITTIGFSAILAFAQRFHSKEAGIIAGFIVAALLGEVRWAKIAAAGWFAFPMPCLLYTSDAADE